MKIETFAIADLAFDPANARKHSQKNLDAIKGSLAKFGQQKPIVIDGKGVVVAGNGTLQVARDLGWVTVKAVRTDLTGADAIAFALADNRTAELAEWDSGVLNETLKSLKDLDFDLGSIGFDDDFMASVEPEVHNEGLTDPDAVPENVETRCKPGDLWVLGNHRLLCGDSTNVQHVERLMGGEKADITFTSPPYNVGCFGFDDGKSKYKKKGDDDIAEDDYFDFLCSFTNVALDVSTYVFFNNQFLGGNRHALAKFFGHYAEMVKDVFPWIKNTAPPNVRKGVFTNRFEFFLCLEKGNTKKGFPVAWQGKFHNVIEGSTAASDNVAKGDHSATMPVYVPDWFLERLDFVKTVYEPFCGSGTTLIACEKHGRRCFGMEIDPKYCDVILTRWESFTGKAASLIAGGETANG